MATLKTTNIKHGSSSSNNIVLGSDGSTTFHNITNTTGKILQYKTAVALGTTSSTNSSHTEITTDLRVTITPTSSTSTLVACACLYLHMKYSGTMVIRLQKQENNGGSWGSWTMVNQPSTFASSNDGNATLYVNTDPYLAMPVRVIETAGNTNERRYSPFWAIQGSNSVGTLNSYSHSEAGTTVVTGTDWHGTSTMTVMEVAA